MKTKNYHYIAAALLLAGLVAARPVHVHAQGALEPPGAPAPTMKSLEQIEARMPISSLPYVIAESGSYYVTGNLTCSEDDHGILIAGSAQSVVLDLNGFTLTGPGAMGGSAIRLDGLNSELTLVNGRLRNWNGGSAYAVHATSAKAVRIADIIVQNCANGISAYNGTVENCRVYDCVLPSGNFFGITGQGLVVINCVVSDCTASTGTAYGFHLSNGAIARNCIAQNLTGGGATASIGFHGQNGAIIESCVARQCHIGINVYNKSLVRNNMSLDNSSHGVQVFLGGSRVEGNNLVQNGGHGLSSAMNSNNLVIANSATLNTVGAFQVIRGSHGPISGSPASSTAVVTNHPWANFVY